MARDESGMAMALAVVVMVLVGVMGAGLLVFVRNDLASVLESNQGQRALNLADAGAQAAKAHLYVADADFRKYDGVTNLVADPPNPESSWSCGAWDADDGCAAAGKQLTNLDGNPDLDATVWIQYLKPAITAAHLNNPQYAPELVPDPTAPNPNYPPGKDYFRVISSGREGNARRTVEAIYNTYNLGVPKAYYTPGNITLNGNAGSIENISLFAGGNVDGKGGAAVIGEDYAYGDWCRAPFNTAARATTSAGIGALGSVTGKVAGRDFDSTTTAPTFAASAPGAPSACGPAGGREKITFPFSAGLPDVEALRAAAQTQSNGLGGDNYYERTSDASLGSASIGATNPVWPDDSVSSTVVFVKFDDIGDQLSWNVGGNCNDDPVRGTVVVENGTFDTSPNKTPLRGSVVIKSAPSPTDVYTDNGNTCMESYAVATGDIVIGGNVAAATQERGNSPGSYGMRLWSWRECYSEDCT